MRLRPVAAAVSLLAVAALTVQAPPAGAVPTVDSLGGVEAHLSFAGRDRSSYLVDLTADLSDVGVSAGTGTLVVAIRKCGSFRCAKAVTYRTTVTEAHLSAAQDMTSGTLLTSIFGKPVSLRWFAPQSPSLASYDDAPRAYVRTYRLTLVQGVFAGMKCLSKEALVYREQALDPEPPARAPAAMPRTAPKALAGMLGGSCQSGL